jgi:macrolide transport system ATP-binding/permease protein
VMRGAMRQAGIGLAIGIPTALVAARFVKAQLYNVSGQDAWVITGAAVALAISASIAGLIPARRAASTDPMTALRSE